MRSQIANRKSKIVIVGAGPAGSSLAIRLAMAGFATTLIERERFPRQKLCGEFISPECFEHFRELGVIEPMLDSGGDRIRETRFFERGGRSIAVPTNWFGAGDFALSLSRAEMDNVLLDRARSVGVQILAPGTVTKLNTVDGRATGLSVRSDDGTTRELDADIFVDATGRSSSLARLADKERGRKEAAKPSFVGFKAHITGAGIEHGICEIYSFPGGYAGLSNVEDGLSNLCFLIGSKAVRDHASDPLHITEKLVTRNARARETLASFEPTGWLAVSIGSFGTKSLTPLPNLFTVGDAAAFIDPFTGSGMVMAFASSRLLADAIVANSNSAGSINREYARSYRREFSSRLRICSIVRHAGFMPRLASGVVSLLGLASGPRRLLARATRR